MPITTRCSAYTAVLVYCDIFKGNEALHKNIHAKYLEQKIIAQASYTKEKSKQVKTEKEEEKWTDMKNLHQARLNWEVLAKTKYQKVVNNKYPTKLVKQDKNWLISSLYTTIPPRRNEYRTLRYYPYGSDEVTKNIVKEHKKDKVNVIYRECEDWSVGNHCFGDEEEPQYYYKMVLREYKTHSTYGDFEMIIDREHPLYIPIKKYINDSRMWMLVDDAEYNSPIMFPNAKGEFMNTASWGRLLNSIFKSTGKKISSTMLRHIYISDKFKGDTPLQVRKDLAKMMGHKPTTAQMVYEKKD